MNEDERVDHVIGRLRAGGLRITPQRRAIVQAVMATKGHISPTALAERVGAAVPGVNLSTVYRTLATLERMDVLAHTHNESGVRYHRSGEGDHVHLVCSRCGSEESLPASDVTKLEELLLRHHDFRPDLTHFAISGLCARCD